MPILETLPDPRLQSLLDFTGQLQLARRQEEEERARSRERLRQRQIVGGGLALGALGGALLGPAAASAIPAGTSAGTAVGLGTGIAPVAGGIGGSSISLGSVLTGARFGAQAGGAFATDDPAAGVQSILQGAATLSSMPELGQLGITPLQVAMAGPEGLQNLVGQAQAGRRQQENLLQQEASRQRLASEAFQNLPASSQAIIATKKQLISELILEHRRGGFGRFGSPEAQQAFEQALAPHAAVIEQEFAANKPPPKPSMEERVASDVLEKPGFGGAWVDDRKTGGVKWVKFNPAFSPQDRADLLTSKIDEFKTEGRNLEIIKRTAAIEAVDNPTFNFNRITREDATTQATKSVDEDLAFEIRNNREARAKAGQLAEQVMPTNRIPHLQSTSEERQVQQEGAERQQAGARAAQQQAEQVQQAQAQQVQQAQEFFTRSVEALVDVQQRLGSDPAKWSREQREEARAPAEGLIAQLSILAPMMSPEQRAQIAPLVKLAQAIVESKQTLGKGLGIPPLPEEVLRTGVPVTRLP